MLSPRLSPNAAGRVALVGAAAVIAGAIDLAVWWYHPAESFTGLVHQGQDPGFADFFYYAMMTAFISPPDDIIAASRGARSATLIGC